jgi:integrase
VTSASAYRPVLANRLEWRDVDLDGANLRIERALTSSGRDSHLVEPKTSSGRRKISLPPQVADALRRHRVEQTERRLLLGSIWIDTGVVLDRGDGDRWKPGSFSKAWSRFAVRNGFADVSLLALRHGSATLMLAGGVPDIVAS